MGFREQSRLHQVGLREAQVFIDGLEPTVVQKRDLHGFIHAQLPLERFPDGLGDGQIGVAVLVPLHAFGRALGDDLLNPPPKPPWRGTVAQPANSRSAIAATNARV